MDHDSPTQLRARAELYLCLARAFDTPAGPGRAEALRDLLAADLEDLAGVLRLPLAPWIAAWRDAAQRLPRPLDWLQAYSAIFLAPPVAARINAGWYLDGALNGGSVRALEEAYRRCGLQPDPAFHDLADHVSLQLQCAAALFDQEAAGGQGTVEGAGEFLHRFPSAWLPGFCADLERAQQGRELPANPWLPLARILEGAVAAHAVAPPQDPKQSRRQLALERARARYAAQGITSEALAEIRRKLQERGLSTDHLPAQAPGAEVT